MITFVRTASTFPGKIAEAVALAKEVAGIVKRVTGKEVKVCSAFGGVLSELAWITEYDNAGQAEELLSKLLGDREYLAAFAKAHGLFVPGSGRDQMWRVI